jgi:hypothetical protein
MTGIRERKVRLELEGLRADEQSLQESIQVAMADGDFRENEPYQIARKRYADIMTRIDELSALLQEQVEEPVGNSLSVGHILRVRDLGVFDTDGNVVENGSDEMLLLFDTFGDPVVDGVLSTGSDLGVAILDGREGVYSLNMGDHSRRFAVALSDESADEYLRRFPVDKREKVARLLRGELY